MMTMRRKPTLAAIGENPTLHPRAFALAQERFPGLKWHLYADSPDSSQAFALSAFLPLLELPGKDALLDTFVALALGSVPRREGRAWDLVPEYADPALLREVGGGEPTTVDILLVADDAVVCVECKFRVDARQGWGNCSQPPRYCEGFHGPGSDRKGGPVSCRLEAPDGDRGPRLYWQAARGHVRDEVFAGQQPGDICPFFPDYQLVRNYLFAAEYARQTGRPHFGVIGVVPASRSNRLLKKDVPPRGRDGDVQDKDAKSLNSSAIQATEDAVLCRLARSRGRDFVFQQPARAGAGEAAAGHASEAP